MPTLSLTPVRDATRGGCSQRWPDLQRAAAPRSFGLERQPPLKQWGGQDGVWAGGGGVQDGIPGILQLHDAVQEFSHSLQKTPT